MSVGGPIRNIRDSWKHPRLAVSERTISDGERANDLPTINKPFSWAVLPLFDAPSLINSSRLGDPR